MSMEISASALNAFQTRQQVTANNIANANTPGFTPDRVDMRENQDGGVQATARQTTQPPAPAAAQPREPAPSTTDLSREMVDMMATEKAYDANATMLASQAAMQGKLINDMV